MTTIIIGVRVRSPLDHTPCYERDVHPDMRHLVSVIDHAFDSPPSRRTKQYIVYEDGVPVAALSEYDFATAWISGDAPLMDHGTIASLPLCEAMPAIPHADGGWTERCWLPDGRIIERWFSPWTQPGEWAVVESIEASAV